MLSQYGQNRIRIALPKGRLWAGTANLLMKAKLGLEDYRDTDRLYRFQSTKFPQLSAKLFHERDIPIQVAVGNYDLGICGLDWVEELLVKYPASALAKVMSLGYGKGNLYGAVSQHSSMFQPSEVASARGRERIVSEYPNQAEAFALSLRLRHFQIFPVWGAAEVYPPENADLVVIWKRDEAELEAEGLCPLKVLLPTEAVLIANQESWKTKDMTEILTCFNSAVDQGLEQLEPVARTKTPNLLPSLDNDLVWLALPDGHQQLPTMELLNKAGLQVNGYSTQMLSRRPTFDLTWIRAKVVRPQDMPLQVANGNFDLAITGKDWLLDHLYRFPSSPVIELLSFHYGEVRIVAVVSRDLAVDSANDLRVLVKSGKLSPLRVASEYVNIADKYVWENHLSPYRIIPTWGASEGFLPEDADLLIENTRTGETLAKHNLKVVEELFSSTACLIGNKIASASPLKTQRLNYLIDILRRATGSS